MKTNHYTPTRTLVVLSLVLLTSFSVFAESNKSVWPFTLNCPPNAYVSCTDELWNLSIYGNATITNGYQTYSAGSPTVQYNLNSCNAGTITRTWMVEDYNWQWHTCTQTIYVSSGANGGPAIYWPEDIELEGCNPNTNPNQLPPPNNYPTWNSGQCSMLGRSYSDMLFTVNSQCKKIMRTWKILDWCNYSPSAGYGIYTKVQFIYIINNTAPIVNCPAEITVNSFNCKNAELIANPLSVDPSVCGGTFEIVNNSPYATAKGNNISGTYPIGTTKVTYTVKYACGKTKSCTVNVVVLNANKPTPYCLGQITTALMPVDTNNDGKVDNGMVELWAKDLNKGSTSSCGNNPLRFSFSKNVNETSKVFTCDQIGKNLVEMWVTDSKGAQNYCIVEVIIQNNGANIPNCHPKPVDPVVPLYSVKGNVLTLTDTPLKDAIITLKYKDPIIKYTSKYDTSEVLQLDSFINLSGYKLYRYILVRKITERKDSTISYFSRSVKTDVAGKYLIDSLTGYRKSVCVSGSYKDDDHKFIDNKDVELLTKFLLGDVTFTSYHQYLASDINEDGKIDIEDQNLLMEFVTGKIAKLPGNNQWYLLDKKATFAKPQDVLAGPLPLVVVLDSIVKNNPVVDFVAIKKGNVSIDPGSFHDVSVDNRNVSPHLASVHVHPNPFTELVTFRVHASQDEMSLLQLFNSNGQEIRSQKYALLRGDNVLNVEINNDNYGLIFYRWIVGNNQHTGTISKIK